MSSEIVNKEVKIEETPKEKTFQDNLINPITTLFSKFYNKSFLNRETYFDVSNLVISFLQLSKKSSPNDLYLNRIKISFNNIDPNFQDILKQEFEEAMNDFRKYFV